MTRLIARCVLLTLALLPLTARPVGAQPLGTFVWQLAPYCNVVTLNTTQDGAIYTFDGTDNQCGAATLATARGLAVVNPNGTVSIGLTIVTSPGALPVHVQANIDLATYGGPWTDDHGNSGTFVFTPVSPSGSPRPLASAGIPAGAVTSAKILDGTVAAIDVNPAEVQRRVSGACAASQLMTGVNEDGTVACSAVPSGASGDITGVAAGVGLQGGGTTGDVTLNVNTSVMQVRVAGSCAPGESIRAVAANGTVTCEIDDAGAAGVTTVTAGNGLNGGGSTSTVTLNVAFAGSGAANSAARSDHSHMGANTSNTHVGSGAGSSASGSGNTAVGGSALAAATTASFNTAVGWSALQSTTGTNNTAVGSQALLSNTTGLGNSAVGREALRGNLTGSQNVAVGFNALSLSTGSRNIGLGYSVLGTLTSGDDNIAIGDNAGVGLSAGSDNVYIAATGAADNGTIRIGSTAQTRTFLAGVRGITTGVNNALAVVVDGNGQLGTISSSARTKFDIQDLAPDVADALSRLRPVSFRYKQAFADGSTPVQYGLIAEEVQQVLPELVALDDQGEPASVKYHVLPALLLAEVQRLQSALTAEAARTTALEAAQAARVSALEAAVADLRATLAVRER